MARTALVIGARNLGAAIAEHLASRDWSIAAVARSKDTIAKLEERVPGALGVALDASEDGALDEAVGQARERFGSVDLMVNAASPGARGEGPFGGGPLIDATPEDLEHYAGAVTRQVFAFLGAGARALRTSGGGTLVQVTGGSSRRAIPGRGPWAAGAFATRALTQAAALELRDERIHVALLIVDATIDSPKTESFTRDTPSDSLTGQADVAAAVEYLAEQPPRAFTHELQITPSGESWVP